MFFVNMIIVGGIFLRVLSCFRVWLWPCVMGVVRGGGGAAVVRRFAPHDVMT